METAIDIFFRKTILECTFDTNKNIYDTCKIKEKIEFKTFFDLGIKSKNENKENDFEYYYNEYLNK